MGSPQTESLRYRSEEPQHPVVLPEGFWLGEVPVTQAQWKALKERNLSQFKGPQRPVERLGWHHCQNFVKKLNDIVPGLDLRLPRESEWEYACRAGTEGPNWLGPHDAEHLARIAWYAETSGGETQPVGTKAPNPWGLYDMLGNVWEWCDDGFGFYDAAPVLASPSPPVGLTRVLRGGAWNSAARVVRAATRDAMLPSQRDGSFGFRLARDGRV